MEKECPACGHEHLEPINCMTPITFSHFSMHLGKKQRGQFNCPCVLLPLERRFLSINRVLLRVWRRNRGWWWDLQYRFNPIVRWKKSQKKFW
jgi:hypothetical protein